MPSRSGNPDDFQGDPDETLTFPKAKMTAEEIYACQVAMKIRYNWTDKEFYSQMEILKTTFPEADEFPTSLYFAKQGLKDLCLCAPNYVVYCRTCLQECERSTEKIKKATCTSCGEDLTENLNEGDLQFVTIPIRDQIESYTSEDNFKHTVRNFSRFTWSHMRGTMHGDNIEKLQFDITLCIDGSQLHRKTGTLSLPAYLLFNNVPLHYQLRYPILAAMFVGKKAHLPPRDMFLRQMVKELEELAKNPITWTDDMGNEIKSFVKFATVITDAVEKSEMMAHIAHNGYYSCHFCEIPGMILTRATHSTLWDPFELRKTKPSTKHPNTIPGGVRYPTTIWEKRYPIRKGGQHRIDIGLDALAHQVGPSGNPNYSIKGIKGTPAISFLPNFHETDSHVSDTLHGICHGIFSDIIKKMITEHGKDHSFARTAHMDYTIVDNLQATLTRCSEVHRNCYPVSQYEKWNAHDELQFMLHSTALLCSNYEVMRNGGLYTVLCHLSNVVYLSRHGRVTDNIIAKLEKELKLFCTAVKETLKEEYCTHKFHVMQHMPRFMRLHGSSAWTDGWNMERLNLSTRNLTNATNNEVGTIVRNFLIKHHSTVFKNIDHFQPQVKELLSNLGVDNTVFGYKFVDKIVKKHPVQPVPRDMKDLVIQEATKNNICSQSYAEGNLVRVMTMLRKGVTLESNKKIHPADSKVRDCYIQVDEKYFGEIVEIFSIKKEADQRTERFIFVLRKFEKIKYMTYDTGFVIQFPINQFPYKRPFSRAGNMHVFLLSEDTLIQKAEVAKLTYPEATEETTLFTVEPNDVHHF